MSTKLVSVVVETFIAIAGVAVLVGFLWVIFA